MKIAFYAPMNAPEGGEASGDRSLARLFLRALRELGHEIDIAARSTTYAATPEDQRPMLNHAREEAADLVRRYNEPAAKLPDLWFTYHVYYRAPDLIGPLVSHGFQIPYMIAEASDAPKQFYGRWSQGYKDAHKAIAQASRVFALSAHDRTCLAKFVRPERLADLPPFIDAEPYRRWRTDKRTARKALAERGIDISAPVLLTVGMMRHRKKLASYQMLADALLPLAERPWTLLVAGDGPARPDVEAAFAKFPPGRVHFLGSVAPQDLPAIYAASDLYLWPGVDEAFGLAFLEAQAAGVPAVAQSTRGIPSVVEDGVGGVLTPVGDTAAYAIAIADLLDDPGQRAKLSRSAAERIEARHTLEHAKAILADHLAQVVRPRA